MINRLFLRILNRPASDDEITRSLILFTEKIQEDHQHLVSQLKEAESSIKDWLEKEEAVRFEAIASAKNELASYKKNTAEAVKRANDKRNTRIQTAKDALAAFDKTLPAKLKKWESDFSSGKSAWRDVNLSKISSKMPGPNMPGVCVQ